MFSRVVVVDGGGNPLYGDLEIPVFTTDADDGLAAISAGHVVPDVTHQCCIVRRCIIRSPVLDKLPERSASSVDDVADLECQII